jgi:hypothetical protein
LTSATFQPVFHGLNGKPIYSSSIAKHIFPASTFPGIWIKQATNRYGEINSSNLEAAKQHLGNAPSERIPESQKQNLDESIQNLKRKIWIHQTNAVYGEVTSSNLEAAKQHLQRAPSGVEREIVQNLARRIWSLLRTA